MIPKTQAKVNIIFSVGLCIIMSVLFLFIFQINPVQHEDGSINPTVLFLSLSAIITLFFISRNFWSQVNNYLEGDFSNYKEDDI